METKICMILLQLSFNQPPIPKTLLRSDWHVAAISSQEKIVGGFSKSIIVYY